MASGYVEVDSRGRISLGKFLEGDGTSFFTVEPMGGGSLLLRPADLMARDDLALAGRPDLIELARKARRATGLDDLPEA